MTTPSPSSVEVPAAEPWLEVVGSALATIRFGSVLITVHEGRVTQVEAVSRTRFSNVATCPSSARSGRG